ncbi:hypothetical protein Ancab_015401 [Ancistrocladus abbreviatus]
MESLDKNFGNEQENFLKRLTAVSDELQIKKNWLRSSASATASAEGQEQDKVLKEKLHKLEAKQNKDKGDKIKSMRGMYKLQKMVIELEKVVVEKDEGMMRLGEKVEAIRQLRVWIDYHQSRCNHL